MTYQYEQLNPEKFQQLCQSLLVKEFPNIQCFPVAQPDGGRDATLPFFQVGRKFMVFQVKFVRNPLADFDRRKWLEEITASELPKLANLIPKGAAGFYLMTNVPGTAHLDSGSIDRLDSSLAATIDVPFFSWWRDDLDRRLDNAWDLKWIYTEIMTGSDLLRALIESGLHENKEHRASAIRAYIQDQYDRDQEVRFKQVELQNRLLDLFIDVPVAPRENVRTRKEAARFHGRWRYVERQLAVPAKADSEAHGPHETSEVRAASLFLHSTGQRHFTRVVLEGAPGQGKSTIAQYICQVHRMKLLSHQELRNVPVDHATCPLRLPFKIDLRDFATWLSRRDPFSADDKLLLTPLWAKTLESFLAAQVRYHSGGTDFTVEDLIAVSKTSALLLVFDGLDEVAEISRRTEVVEEINKGVGRLNANALSLQVVVTSRPAAFAKSPGLPEDTFYYFQLESVSRVLIEEYAERWLKARKLYGHESAEVRKILKEKLDQPHLRDLARNPMQLAIFLSLIQRRGSSLPDKRTALYDNYIDLFFGREAEKSAVVREHRDLLMDLHRYLAWILHSEAEQGHHRASITTERLHRLLRTYLEDEGHDPNLVDQLFHGMVERVVALVSRVEGTFEFEVQPLREYFAARYLYETAPYSPPGDEKRGTKPDRFDAIARNFYWLNVTRFYAGCFSKGELPALVDRLQELVRDKQFRRLSHPRILAGILLSDWVFAQHPRSVKDVVGIVIDGLGLRYIVNSGRRRLTSGTRLILPKRNGNEELVDRCFDLLRSDSPLDFALEVTDVLKANCRADELATRWLQEIVNTNGLQRDRWFEYGLRLGTLPQLSDGKLEDLISDAPLQQKRLMLIFRARHAVFIQNSKDRAKVVIDALLAHHEYQRAGKSVLSTFAHFLMPFHYAMAFRYRHAAPLATIWKELHFAGELIYDEPGDGAVQAVGDAKRLIHVIKDLASLSGNEWATSLAPWEKLVESARELFGDRWRISCIASVAAGIKSQHEKAAGYSALFDHSVSLCRRARHARLRAGQAAWWEAHLKAAASNQEKMFVCLLAIMWCTPSTLLKMVSLLEKILESLAPSDWSAFASGLEQTLGSVGLAERANFGIELPEKLKPRLAATLGLRAGRGSQALIFRRYLQQYEGHDLAILKLCHGPALDVNNATLSSWNPRVALIARAYRAGLISESYADYQVARHGAEAMKLQLAEEIADNAEKYPGFLVAVAESKLRGVVAETITPVATIAEKDRWFAQQRSRVVRAAARRK